MRLPFLTYVKRRATLHVVCGVVRPHVRSGPMPKETDPERIRLLLRILRDPASNVVMFTAWAFRGGGEPDDLGLDRLLADVPPATRAAELRAALASFLDSDGRPNRVEYAYADSDPETIYEFRLVLGEQRVYVKTELEGAESDDPTLVVRSVKRQN